MAYLGLKVDDKLLTKLEASLKPLLASDEQVVAVFKANRLKPLTDALVMTNRRFLAVSTANLSFFNEIAADDIKKVEVESPRFRALAGVFDSKLFITKQNGSKDLIASVYGKDEEAIEAVFKKMSGSPQPFSEADLKNRKSQEQKTASEAKKAQLRSNFEEKYGETIEINNKIQVRMDEYKKLVIGQVNKPTIREAIELSRENEKPEFILGSQTTGALIAFKDRCVIVKKGLGTSFMAGSLGGGRVTTFAYRDVTAIEYNSGFVNGVLEILTASYQGSANKDFWQGTFSGRNKNSNDPYTLSNTLPLDKMLYSQARTKIQWMQEQVSLSKQGGAAQVTVVDATAQLEKLASLHRSGVLSDKEFSEAKAKLLNKI